MRSVLVAFLVWTAGFAPARAEVVAAAPGAIILQAEARVTASPDQAWRALTRVKNWWSSAHTYSGDSSRLRLDARAGGCWCERWDGQSVEHARVVMVMERDGSRTLRVLGGFGPLQEMGVSGVLTFVVAPDPQGARITMTYRVSGDPGLSLDQIAPGVDAVLTEQFGRLGRFAVSGSPD